MIINVYSAKNLIIVCFWHYEKPLQNYRQTVAQKSTRISMRSSGVLCFFSIISPSDMQSGTTIVMALFTFHRPFLGLPSSPGPGANKFEDNLLVYISGGRITNFPLWNLSRLTAEWPESVLDL